MSKHTAPWTYEDFEMYPQGTVEIYDPNEARNIAVFYDEDEAREYLEWRNKRQAKLRRRQAKRRAKVAKSFLGTEWANPRSQ